MDRAKAAQQMKALAEQGQIKHKPVVAEPKLSKKARLAAEEEAKRRAKAGSRAAPSNRRDGKIGAPGHRTATASTSHTPSGEAARPKKAPVDLGYKGTMRPAEPSYTGTMKKSAPTSRPQPPTTTSRPSDRFAALKRPPDEAHARPVGEKQYRYYESDEDDYDEDDSGSEDIGGGGWDEMEREEQESLRIAKEEDARELREENRHRAEKLARKKALERLAASRAAREG